MKQVRKIVPLIGALAICFAAMGQTKKGVDNALSKKFDQVIGKVNKTNLSRKEEIARMAKEEITNDELFARELDAAIKEQERQKAVLGEMEKQYIPVSKNKQQIDKDFMAFLSEIPEPVSDLPQASRTTKIGQAENIYTEYVDKVKSYGARVSGQARQNIQASMKDPEKMKQEAYENSQKAQKAVDNNAIIQEMGGMDKLKNMTPEQRAALARQMSEKAKQNPAAYTKPNDPKRAFSQKLATDPAYAEKFSHMNNEQKEEEYNAFLKENGYADIPTPDKASPADNNAAISIEIDKRISLIMQHAREMIAVIAPLQQKLDTYFQETRKKLDEEYAKRYAALPEIAMGEAGREKDAYPLDIAYNVIIYPLEKRYAASSAELWKRYCEISKITVAEYNDFLTDYWGKNKATDQLMAQKGLTPASIAASLTQDLIRLAKAAESQTTQNASWQRQFNNKVLRSDE